jgi:phenylalanyl-tRNA synthetase beta chain
MKTTYNWLKEYCDIDMSPEELGHKLAMSGCLVEEIEPVGDDVMLFADVTSNRPDHLGALGIARDVCALTGQSLRMPDASIEEGAEKIAELTSVEVVDADLCPRYTARLIKGVKIGPSPDWLKQRIEAIGLRSVNNVVDVTNYVLFECGQPLHTFDFDKLKGGKIIVRRAVAGEILVSIDETKCKLTPDMLAIADAERPIAIAGVMGGLDTEINQATTNVLLESAQFEKTSSRRTSRALQINSDSSYRFERGVDPVQVEWASRRAAKLIQEVAGGVICEGVIDTWQKPYEAAQVTLRVARLNSLLGTAIKSDEAVAILDSLGFGIVSKDAEKILVAIPPFRAVDVTREVDLIEEVIRIYGYDKIPETTSLAVTVGRVSKSEKVEAITRDVLTGLGYHETMTNTFCSDATQKLVSPWTNAEALVVQNTVRSDENRLRLSILPELLRVKRTNIAHGVAQSPVFEISRVYIPRADNPQPEEKLVLALLTEQDILGLKGALEALLLRLDIAGDVQVEAIDMPFFEKNSAAKLSLNGKLIAVMGRVSKSVADAYDLVKAPCVAEVDFAPLVEAAELDVIYKKLPAFPGSARDLAIVVDEAVTWAQAQEVIRSLDLPHLESLEFFDVFRGKQVVKGKKSLAFSLTFRAPDRTLTRDEVEESRQKAIAALTEKLGAELRG